MGDGRVGTSVSGHSPYPTPFSSYASSTIGANNPLYRPPLFSPSTTKNPSTVRYQPLGGLAYLSRGVLAPVRPLLDMMVVSPPVSAPSGGGGGLSPTGNQSTPDLPTAGTHPSASSSSSHHHSFTPANPVVSPYLPTPHNNWSLLNDRVYQTAKQASTVLYEIGTKRMQRRQHQALAAAHSSVLQSSPSNTLQKQVESLPAPPTTSPSSAAVYGRNSTALLSRAQIAYILNKLDEAATQFNQQVTKNRPSESLQNKPPSDLLRSTNKASPLTTTQGATNRFTGGEPMLHGAASNANLVDPRRGALTGNSGLASAAGVATVRVSPPAAPVHRPAPSLPRTATSASRVGPYTTPLTGRLKSSHVEQLLVLNSLIGSSFEIALDLLNPTEPLGQGTGRSHGSRGGSNGIKANAAITRMVDPNTGDALAAAPISKALPAEGLGSTATHAPLTAASVPNLRDSPTAGVPSVSGSGEMRDVTMSSATEGNVTPKSGDRSVATEVMPSLELPTSSSAQPVFSPYRVPRSHPLTAAHLAYIAELTHQVALRSRSPGSQASELGAAADPRPGAHTAPGNLKGKAQQDGDKAASPKWPDEFEETGGTISDNLSSPAGGSTYMRDNLERFGNALGSIPIESNALPGNMEKKRVPKREGGDAVRSATSAVFAATKLRAGGANAVSVAPSAPSANPLDISDRHAELDLRPTLLPHSNVRTVADAGHPAQAEVNPQKLRSPIAQNKEDHVMALGVRSAEKMAETPVSKKEKVEQKEEKEVKRQVAKGGRKYENEIVNVWLDYHQFPEIIDSIIDNPIAESQQADTTIDASAPSLSSSSSSSVSYPTSVSGVSVNDAALGVAPGALAREASSGKVLRGSEGLSGLDTAETISDAGAQTSSLEPLGRSDDLHSLGGVGIMGEPVFEEWLEEGSTLEAEMEEQFDLWLADLEATVKDENI